MSDIFVYILDVDPANERVMLVNSETPEDAESWVASVADAFQRHCIYFFAEFVDDIDQEWEPTRWWRAVTPEGEIWAESSDSEEIREAAAEIGVKPQRLFEKIIKDQEWRDV